jgi:hypothetical protein
MWPAAPRCLVVNVVFDIMIPVRNSYLQSEHLPNAVLPTSPDSGAEVPRLSHLETSWHLAKHPGTEHSVRRGFLRSRCDPDGFEGLARGPQNYL